MIPIETGTGGGGKEIAERNAFGKRASTILIESENAKRIFDPVMLFEQFDDCTIMEMNEDITNYLKIS